MKLVHFITSLEMGGAQRVLYDLVAHLQKQGYEQTILYIHDGPYTQKFNELGIPLYHIQGLITAYDPLALFRVWRLLKHLGPDVLHTLLWSANFIGRIIARMLKIPCVSVLHNNLEQDGKLRYYFDRMTIQYAQQIVAVSEDVKQSCITRYRIIPAEKIQVIRNGIRISDRVTLVTRAFLGLSSEHCVIGSVGRFEPVKRYDLLLRVFAKLYSQLSHTRLLLIGSGSQEQLLRDYAHKLGIAHVVIFVVGHEAASYYKLFDLFVQSSRQEGISLALLEAMAARCACIVMSQDGYHPVIVHKQTGLVVPADNEQALLDVLSTCIDNKNMRLKLGVAACDQVTKQFDADAMLDAYQQLFERVG